ncbi:MAG: chemotaxis protein CheA [Planctomycetota bacterium]
MHGSTGELSTRLNTLLQQIGLELAFVDPAQPDGIRGLAGLVASLAEAAGSGSPEPIATAIAAARGWLAERAAADSRFTNETIAAFHEWHPWLTNALSAWAAGHPLPAPLPGWAVTEPPTAAVLPAPADTATVRPEIADQQVDISIRDADDEMMQLFCAEAQDLLQDIERAVLVLETNPSDAATIDTLFRAFHTFKGNVGVMKLTVLQQLTHELESLLEAARRGTLTLGRDSFEVILAGQDVLARYVAELAALLGGKGQKSTIPLPIPRLIAEARGIVAGTRVAPATPRLAPPPASAASAPGSVAATPAPLLTPTVTPPEAPAAPPATPAAPPATPAAPPAPPAGVAKPDLQRAATPQGGIVRVDTIKLDSLIDLVGELVIAQSMVVQNTAADALADSHLSRSLGQLRGITSDLQRTAMSLRMVPIGSTFQKMARLVRDLAVQQDKAIQLVLQGEDTELDRTIVEEINDPLVHMIRNSADHGIEAAADRRASGKPPVGTITLRAFHQGGFIVIQIRDDGRGLDPERIRAKAVDRGLIRADEPLDDHEILDLIFAPGFSTAEKVTDLSGRGVGMDVVRRNIEKLRGKIEIDSVVGQGTAFTIYLPLTLAIIEGLIVGVGDQRYVVPTLSVRESFRPLPGMVSTVQGRGEMVSVRGRLTPMLRLGRHLNTPARANDPTQGIVVVVESGQDARCLFVDDLLGKQEVVIKSLGDMFRSQTEFAGAAILGDGRVGLILDVNALVKLKSRTGETSGHAARAALESP